MARQGTDYPLDDTKGASEGDRWREMADTASDSLKDAGESAQEMAGKATEKASEYGEKALKAAQQVKPVLQKPLREQPLATLAGVAAVGFLLGALWRR